jgi:hypothetical protein
MCDSTMVLHTRIAKCVTVQWFCTLELQNVRQYNGFAHSDCKMCDSTTACLGLVCAWLGLAVLGPGLGLACAWPGPGLGPGCLDPPMTGRPGRPAGLCRAAYFRKLKIGKLDLPISGCLFQKSENRQTRSAYFGLPISEK